MDLFPGMLADGSVIFTPPSADGQIASHDSDGTFAKWVGHKSRTRYRNVAEYATGGDGSSGDPWTGWTDGTNLCGAVPADWTTYFFRAGHYSFSSLPACTNVGLALVGEEGSHLHHTGTGPAIQLHPTSGNTTTNGVDDDDWVFGGRVQSLLLIGNENTTYGFDCVGLRCWLFDNVRAVNCATAGFRFRAIVTNQFNNLAVTHRYNGNETMDPRPLYGVVIDRRATADLSNANTFLNFVAEGCAEDGAGINVADAGSLVTEFIEGASEGNAGRGMHVGNGATVITQSYHFEVNSQGDVNLATGSKWVATDTYASSSVTDNVKCNGTAKIFATRGLLWGITPVTGQPHTFIDTSIKGNGTGNQWGAATSAGYPFDNTNSDFLRITNVGTGAAMPTLTGPGGPKTFTFPGGSEHTPSMVYRHFQKTLFANCTINAPTGGTLCQGHELLFMFGQDGTGGRSVTWNSIYGTVPGVAQSPLSITGYTFRYRTAQGKWECVGYFNSDIANNGILSTGTVAFAANQSMGGFKLTSLGTPTADTDAATKAYVDGEISDLVDSAPAALDTLNELAAALGDDENFSTTVSTSIGLKLAKASNLSDVADAATARTNLGAAAASHSHTASDVSDFAEAVDDRVSTLIVAGTKLTGTYDDGAGTLTLDVDAFTASDLSDFNSEAVSAVEAEADLTLKQVTHNATTGGLKTATFASPTTTIDWSGAGGNNQTLTLTGDTEIAHSNALVGQWMRLRIVQDSTGARTITQASGTTAIGDVSINTTAEKISYLVYHCVAADTFEVMAGPKET